MSEQSMQHQQGSFILRGWHVLAMLLGFFAIIVVANTFLITLAVKSFPGEQEKKSYLQGLTYNQTLNERAAQRALGWDVSISSVRLVDGIAVLTIDFSDAGGTPVRGLTLTGVLGRPVTDAQDRVLSVSSRGDGRYDVRASDVTPGLWTIEIEAVRADGMVFAFDNKMVLE